MTLLVGCAKNEDNSEKINVVFSVDDKASFGADTKAIKEGWAFGDEILIMFEEQGDLLDPSTNNNTLCLSYNGEEWYIANDDIDALQLTEGTFTAIHHPGAIMIGNKEEGSGSKHYLSNYKGGEYLTFNGEWTLQGTTLNLGKISMKRRDDMFQISVQDLADEPGNWTMSIYNKTGGTDGINLLHWNKECKLYVRNYQGNTTFGLDSYRHEGSTGFKVDDDVVFTFSVITASENMDYYDVAITNGTINTYNRISGTPKFQGGKAYLMPNINGTKWQ